MNYKIVGVEALYPRINKTYKFDNGETVVFHVTPWMMGLLMRCRSRWTRSKLKR